MNYKYLIVFLFLGIAPELWSQLNMQALSYANQSSETGTTVFSKEEAADTIYNKDAGLLKKYIFAGKEDTIIYSDTIRNGIIGKALKYIGVGYHYGQSSEKGFDCSGYVKYVYGSFGLPLPHSSYEQYKMSTRIKAPEAEPGDLVFFITRGGKRISHVGIYLGDNQFIHSTSRGKTVSVSSLDAEYYKRHLAAFGSVLKLTVYKKYIEPYMIFAKPLIDRITLFQSVIIESKLRPHKTEDN